MVPAAGNIHLVYGHTSRSLGATTRWPVGLPKAIKYIHHPSIINHPINPQSFKTNKCRQLPACKYFFPHICLQSWAAAFCLQTAKTPSPSFELQLLLLGVAFHLSSFARLLRLLHLLHHRFLNGLQGPFLFDLCPFLGFLCCCISTSPPAASNGLISSRLGRSLCARLGLRR